MPHALTAATIDTEEALRSLLGDPQPVIRAKVTDRLNDQTRIFIERSPFVCLATCDASGNCDVSPRGDAAGFVRILDPRTLLLPERPGNRLADALTNILHNPRVGLLFVLPGVGETFRVNGRATLTTDAALLAPSTIEGKPPKLGILVDLETAYTHCPQAFLHGVGGKDDHPYTRARHAHRGDDGARSRLARAGCVGGDADSEDARVEEAPAVADGRRPAASAAGARRGSR